ncbi:pyruvate dehydrogenase E1 component subunit alpha-3, chloroplastic-like protein [Tanacetum coccineum]
MAAFTGTAIIQPLHSTTRSPATSTASQFLGSVRSLRVAQPVTALQRRSAVVAVSEVVKDKKQKSSSVTAANLLLTKEEGLEVYEDMYLGRAFEDMCAQMYYRGKMFGFVHLYNGQEAVSSDSSSFEEGG